MVVGIKTKSWECSNLEHWNCSKLHKPYSLRRVSRTASSSWHSLLSPITWLHLSYSSSSCCRYQDRKKALEDSESSLHPFGPPASASPSCASMKAELMVWPITLVLKAYYWGSVILSSLIRIYWCIQSKNQTSGNSNNQHFYSYTYFSKSCGVKS